MKNKFIIINFIMSIVILFAILFQSVDNYEHLVKKMAEKECHHKKNLSDQITHQHQGFETCFVCDFSFTTFIYSNLESFSNFKKIEYFTSNSFYYKELNHYYSGSTYSLRGPPKI